MDLRQFFVGRALGFLILLVIIGGFYAFNSYIYKEKQADPNEIYEPQRMTLFGKIVCLPPKDPNAPNTKECASGLLADNGMYYALDFSLMSQTLPEDYNSWERIRASGVFTPIERLSTDHWQKYNTVGIFSVTDSLERI